MESRRLTEKKMTQEVVKVTGPCQLFFGLFDLRTELLWQGNAVCGKQCLSL